MVTVRQSDGDWLGASGTDHYAADTSCFRTTVYRRKGNNAIVLRPVITTDAARLSYDTPKSLCPTVMWMSCAVSKRLD